MKRLFVWVRGPEGTVRLAGVEHADKIVDQVTNAVAQFEMTARQLRVEAGKGLELVAADVRKRLELIGSTG